MEIKVGRVPIITNDEGLLWDGEYTGGELRQQVKVYGHGRAAVLARKAPTQVQSSVSICNTFPTTTGFTAARLTTTLKTTT
ncbi:MAG: hypothetical protein IJP68_12885 [Selenomonadaceae bacterium]|nr:hypothetical protein [Selenomonadaceae bacterium]